MEISDNTRKHLLRNCAIATVVSLCALATLYWLTSAYVIRQAEKNIENLLLAHKGIHHYVQQVMHPALYGYQQDGEIPADFYAPELFSSSFIVRNQHLYFNRERELLGQPPIYYKMAAINPRNPVNKADELESRLIRQFNQDRTRQKYREIIKKDGREYLYVALPFLENNKACLTCHGEREQAPVQLQARYPGEGGFNEREGEIRAIISVRAPLEHEYGTVMIVLAAALVGLLTISGLFLFSNRLRNLVASRTAALEKEISERQLAEQQVFASAERFSAVLDSIDSLVYVADMESYELLFINRYGREIFGEVVGKTCWQALQVDQQGPCTFCTNSRLVDDNGEPAGVHVWEFQNTTDQEWYECRDRAIRWADGRLVRMEIATNITARHRAQAEKEKLEQQLRQAQKMEAVGTLAGGIAHDFNNILTPILGYADLVLDELPADSDAAAHQGEIIHAGLRAKELVKHILTFSRQSEQERRPIHIEPLLKESIKLLRSSIPSTIEIRQDIDGGVGSILADPTQIHQIVMNLCTNAYHAMRETGGVLAIALHRVELTAEDYPANIGLPPGPYLKLEVSDNGPGILPEVKERIFEPYFTTKGRGEGTGMGLAIVHGIAQAHHGHITCYSEVGKGTTFHVYLPEVPTRADGEESTVETEAITGSERILVVDDEPAIATMEKLMLEGLGYRVTALTNSQEALDLFTANPAGFDLLITDMTMPHLTGAQLVQAVRAVRPDLPSILCTGFSETINGAKAKALGINAYVMKPIAKRDLALEIRKVLAGG